MSHSKKQLHLNYQTIKKVIGFNIINHRKKDEKDDFRLKDCDEVSITAILA